MTTTAPPLQPGTESLPAASVAAREQIVVNQLMTIAKAETLYFAENGKYGSMSDLVDAGSLNIAPQGIGYTLDLTATDSGYEVLAVPVEYGPKGRRSFYLDESGKIRGDDHQGGAPSKSDPIVQ